MSQEVVTVALAGMLGTVGQVMVGPVGELADDRETGPSKLLMLLNVICMGPSDPRLMFAGFALIVKSPTCTRDLAW